jgi:hypothetical protein
MECCGNMAGSYSQSNSSPEAAEHAHAVRPPSARKIVRFLKLLCAARLGGG